MADFTSTMFFGVFLTFAAFVFGQWVFEKTKHFPLFSPSIIAIATIICILHFFQIDYDAYNVGGDLFTKMLLPATVALALPIYRHRQAIKGNLLPILIGAGVGSFTGIGSVFVLCKLFGFDDMLIHSMLGKSITTPMGIEVTKLLGGEPSIVIVGIMISGLLGTITIPIMTKLLRLKNSIAIGIASGTSSHAMGTSKAMEMGDDIGAMSSIAIGIAGVFTILFALLLPW